MLKAKIARRRAQPLYQVTGSDTVRVFVGQEGREFVFAKKLLASTSTFFSERLDTSAVNLVQNDVQLNTIWLEDLCPEMFELFAHWVHERGNLRVFIDEAEANDCCEDLHCDLINLHLFAAHIGIAALQDLAMDRIQDMYLRCNWDITPKMVSHIYNECDAEDSRRLRKWVVAMAAWSLGGCMEKAGTADNIEALFQSCSEFWTDYLAHLSKTSKSRIRLQVKNPQLRLPSNNLHNEERQFGFRQCSFHTHRSTVGQGKCPHTVAPIELPVSPVSDEDSDGDLPLILEKSIISPRTVIFDMYLHLP